MAMSKAKTVADYLDEMSNDQRTSIKKVRAVLRKRLPKGYAETMDFGMITYNVPLSRYPDTYNGHPLMYAALAAQKNYCAVYLMGIYGGGTTAKAFKDAFASAGKKLDMGKSCVRFKSVDDLVLELP